MDIVNKGAIFCHVDVMIHIGQEIPDMTLGNQV